MQKFFEELIDSILAIVRKKDDITVTSMDREFGKAHWIYTQMDESQRVKASAMLNTLLDESNKKAAKINKNSL